MIEVLFGESESEAMKIAKEEGIISGSKEEVICLAFMLDIGDIAEKVDSQYRQDLIFDMYTQNGYDNSPEVLKKIKEAGKQYVYEQNRLMYYLSKGESIRIWYSNAAYSMCGFYYICNLLRNTINEIFVVKLPDYIQINHSTIVEYQHFGEVVPDKFNNFLRYEKELFQAEVIMFANHWLELVEDNSSLRAVVNGQLIGVPEEFYDHLIYKRIGLSTVKEIQLIGDIIGNYPLGIGDWWYASRIEHMIQIQKLKIVKDSDIKYKRIISLSIESV